MFSRISSCGAVSAETFNLTIRNLHKRPVFEKVKAIRLIFYLR